MAKNLIACGDVYDYTVPASTTILSGAGVLIGDAFGVAIVGGVTDDVIAVQAEGVFELPKRTHASSAAIGQGDKVYWDDTSKRIDNTSNGGVNKVVGFAYTAALSTVATVQVNLEPIPSARPAAANVPAEATVNGSDAATTQALANALKIKVNAILTALKGAGIMVPD